MRIFIFVSIFIFSFCNGQYFSAWYNTENGLPQNSIKDIVKDKYGFIWLSTENGLVRYDGSSFSSYSNFNTSDLHFEYFYGNVNNDSIIAVNNADETTIVIKGRDARNSSKKLRSYIYINNHMYKCFSKNFVYRQTYNDINYFIKLPSGNYYFSDNLIKYVDKKTKKETFIKLKFRMEDMKNIFAHSENIFISEPTDKKVYKIEKGLRIPINAPKLYSDPQSIIYWSQINQQTFIINKNNIYLSKSVNGELRLTYLLNYKDIGTYSFYSIYYDEQYNKIYLGSIIKGLNIINISNFFVAKQNKPFADEVYYTSLPFGKNTIITDGGLVFNKYGLVKDMKFETIADKRGITLDNSGNIFYIKNYNLVKRYRESNFEKKEVLDINSYVMRTFKNENAYVLATESEKGENFLNIYNDDKFNSLKKQYKFTTSINSAIFYDKNTILVGCNKGLYQVSLLNNKIEKISSDLYIRHILKTSEGNFWITTQNKGFYLLKNKKLIKMPYDINGYLSSAHYFLEDKAGYLWISTNNGLYKVLKNKLLEYSKNPAKNAVTYYRYDKQDGLKENEFNGGATPCATILENGEFVFPSMEGFVFFNPENIKSFYPDPSSIYIERANIDSTQVQIKETLNIPSGYKNAEIMIDFPYYANRDNLYSEAKLDGLNDSGWERLKNNKYLINKIPPGNYTLNIRILVSPEGKFIYKKINISLEAKFYQTFWFKILVLLIFILLILWIIKARTNILASKNKSLEKEVFEKNDKIRETLENLEKTQRIFDNETENQDKIIKTISHDIATPIKFLTNLSKNLHETDDISLQKKYFSIIYKFSEELYKFTVGLKEYSDLYREEKKEEKEEYLIFEAIETKVDLFKELALFNNTQIYNKADKNLKTDIHKNIFQAIIHNILDNAIKNTKKGEIIITTDLKNNSIAIIISDTGFGISEEQIHYYNELFENFDNQEFLFKKNGLGLHMVLYFVKKIEGTISFKKNSPSGTKVEIMIKKQ